MNHYCLVTEGAGVGPFSLELPMIDLEFIEVCQDDSWDRYFIRDFLSLNGR